MRFYIYVSRDGDPCLVPESSFESMRKHLIEDDSLLEHEFQVPPKHDPLYGYDPSERPSSGLEAHLAKIVFDAFGAGLCASRAGGGLTRAQIEDGLRNLGHDPTCGSCMSQFYTGFNVHPHTCERNEKTSTEITQ